MINHPECEYCGNAHDVRELCGKRMSRRRFFSLSARAIVGVAIAPQIIEVAQALARPAVVCLPEGMSGTYGGIDRASFSFWRNQSAAGATSFDGLRDALTKAYNDCHKSPPFDYASYSPDMAMYFPNSK